ncbi:MAG: hypothetical protein RLZZ401_8 [Pseudomonadota bacterium]|jgi:sirohydrochlorin cobaltochelatase
MRDGVIVLAHGSRDPLWRAPVEAVAARIRQRSNGSLVECAYLELCAPDLSAAAATLLAAGVESIRVLPLFFGLGKHAREDLPLLLANLRSAHPTITIQALASAGENPAVLDLLAELALEGNS